MLNETLSGVWEWIAEANRTNVVHKSKQHERAPTPLPAEQKTDKPQPPPKSDTPPLRGINPYTVLIPCGIILTFITYHTLTHDS